MRRQRDLYLSDRNARRNRLALVLLAVAAMWMFSLAARAAEPTHLAVCLMEGVPSGSPDYDCGFWEPRLIADVVATDLVMAAPTADGAFWTTASEIGADWWSWDPTTNEVFPNFGDYWPPDGGPEDPDDPEEPGEDDLVDFFQSGVAFGAALTMCAAFWGLGKGVGAVVGLFRPRD